MSSLSLFFMFLSIVLLDRFSSADFWRLGIYKYHIPQPERHFLTRGGVSLLVDECGMPRNKYQNLISTISVRTMIVLCNWCDHRYEWSNTCGSIYLSCELFPDRTNELPVRMNNRLHVREQAVSFRRSMTSVAKCSSVVFASKSSSRAVCRWKLLLIHKLHSVGEYTLHIYLPVSKDVKIKFCLNHDSALTTPKSLNSLLERGLLCFLEVRY